MTPPLYRLEGRNIVEKVRGLFSGRDGVRKGLEKNTAGKDTACGFRTNLTLLSVARSRVLCRISAFQKITTIILFQFKFNLNIDHNEDFFL